MTRDLLVGLLFLAAILVVGMITFMVKGVPAGAAAYRLVVDFEDVGGLQRGDPVRVRGMKFGEVEEITFSEEKVSVSLRLFREILPKEGYAIEVLPSSPLGGTYLRYAPGDGEAVAVTGLVGRAGGDLFGTINEIISENRESIRKSISSLQNILRTFDEEDGVVSALIKREDLRENFVRSIENLATITGRIEEGEGTLGALISDDQWRSDISSTLSGIAAAVEQVRSGEGVVGRLIYDPDIESTIERILQRADQITDDISRSEGLLGRLLYDKSLGKMGEEIVLNLRRFSDDLRNEGSLLHALTSDPTTRDLFTATLSNLNEITTRVQSGPGTLHSLVYEVGLYEQATEAVTLLRDTTEDAREQAPISTFFGILMAPF